MTEDDRHARDPDSEPLTVDGVEVAPPVTEGQARVLAATGLLADDPAGLGVAWRRVESTWAATVERARRELGEARLHERVDDEWSFAETLRHLVFVTDLWISGGVLGSDAYHQLGLPPDFADPADFDIDVAAAPDLDEVLAARRACQAAVGTALESAHEYELSQPCHGRLSIFSRRGAFQVVVAEEWFHHGFATRDLAALR